MGAPRAFSSTKSTRRPLFARWRVMLLVLLIGVGTALFFPTGQQSAQAACSVKNLLGCLPGGDSAGSALDCKQAPPASRPDSGLAGWFLRQPAKPSEADPFAKEPKVSTYDVYGYAGLNYSTYDLGCGPEAIRDPSALTTNTIANLLYSPALWFVALDNSVREYAYQPSSMWGWTDNLVKRASSALADRVFNVWGVLVLGIVGVWLLWGARGGNMSAAVTTAGWALLVMALVSAVAAWPLNASRAADSTLTGALGQVSGAMNVSVGSSDDGRSPAVRASGVMTSTVLYQQWLRGTLGSADSDVAKKYGPQLYQAHAISWHEAQQMQGKPDRRSAIFAQKAKLWEATAEKVKAEDPEAYEYLVGRKGTERVGAAMLALISALVVTPFDLAASVLVLVAFLIIRLAVAFLPAIGTIGILRPASGPLRMMLRTVVAAIINCVIFGVGSAVFLLAVEVITGTPSLAGWQQVLLMWLTGVILWLLLRPYRRLTQLTGVDPMSSVTGGMGRMQQRVLGDLRRLSAAGVGAVAGSEPAAESQRAVSAGASSERGRPETWSRGVTLAALGAASGPLGRAALASAAGSSRLAGDAQTVDSIGLPSPRQAVDDRIPDRYRQGETPAVAVGSATYPRMPISVTGESHPIYRPGRPENASRAMLPVVGARATAQWNEGHDSSNFDSADSTSARPETVTRPPAVAVSANRDG